MRDRCLAALLLVLPLSLFAELLIARTHHRPLGAATFASVALVGFSLLWPLARLLSGSALTSSALTSSALTSSALTSSALTSSALSGRAHSGRAHFGRAHSGLVLGSLGALGLVVVIARLVG